MVILGGRIVGSVARRPMPEGSCMLVLTPGARGWRGKLGLPEKGLEISWGTTEH